MWVRELTRRSQGVDHALWLVVTLALVAAYILAEPLVRHLQDQDPLLRALGRAPDDDEVVSADEVAAIAEGMRQIQEGKTRPWEQIRGELDASQ